MGRRSRIVIQLSLLTTLAIELCHAQAAPAPRSALVTFYTHGSQWTSGVPGVQRHSIYVGNVFDGAQGLFSFRDGFSGHNNRFLTMSLPAGPHTFGASYGKKPLPRETLQITLIAGEHYLIRAQEESAGVPGVFALQHGRLDLVACEDAEEEAGGSKPVKEKGFWRYLKAHRDDILVTESAMPQCPVAGAQPVP